MGRDTGIYERRCDKDVHTAGMRMHYHQCLRRAVVQREGRWFCKQHDPQEADRLTKIRQEKLNLEWAQRQKLWGREALDKKLIAALLKPKYTVPDRREDDRILDLVWSWKKSRKKFEGVEKVKK